MLLEIPLSGFVAPPAIAVRLSSFGTRCALVMFVIRIEAFALYLPIRHLNSPRPCRPVTQRGIR
jgi:hypothetical protein